MSEQRRGRGSRQGYYENDAQGRYYENGPGQGQQGGYYQDAPGEGYYEGGQGQNYYENGQGQGYYENGQGQGYYEGGQGYYGNQGPQGYYGNGPQGYYQEPPRKKKKKKKRGKVLFAVSILVLLILFLGLFVMAQLNRMDRVNLGDILVNAGIGGSSGYRNIALFGVDSRAGELASGTNSDTIIVCSINQKTGDIKLASVYRDTYLDHTDGSYGKATECYAKGGAELAINMLNKNLDLDITDFVTVNFNAIVEAVDLLGGIEVDVTEEELQWLNGYAYDLINQSQVENYTTYEPLASAGTQQLNGVQALAYCRIRYTTGWDFKRTERQREVINKIFQKAQAQGVTALAGLVNQMLPDIATSLTNTEILSLAAGIANYKIVDSIGFPYNQTTAVISAGDCVIPINLSANVSQLHADLFGVQGYTPSDTVQQISSQIISATGIQ